MNLRQKSNNLTAKIHNFPPNWREYAALAKSEVYS
jgi:hypothetical protein